MASAQDTAETQVATKPVEAFVGYEARNLYQLYLEWVRQGRPRRQPAPVGDAHT